MRLRRLRSSGLARRALGAELVARAGFATNHHEHVTTNVAKCVVVFLRRRQVLTEASKRKTFKLNTSGANTAKAPHTPIVRDHAELREQLLCLGGTAPSTPWAVARRRLAGTSSRLDSPADSRAAWSSPRSTPRSVSTLVGAQDRPRCCASSWLTRSFLVLPEVTLGMTETEC
jgi:hypothetical protein